MFNRFRVGFGVVLEVWGWSRVRFSVMVRYKHLGKVRDKAQG